MGSYSQIIIHVVFATKHRQEVLLKSNRDRLYQYMVKVLENRDCHVYAINGTEDHMHLLFSLPGAVCLSDLVKEVKVSSNIFIKREKLFPDFSNWQKGYGAFTVSYQRKDQLIEYIKHQERHHEKKGSQEEYRQILEYHKIEIDERYFE